MIARISPLCSSPKQPATPSTHKDDEMMVRRKDLFNTADVFSSLLTVLSEMLSNGTVVKKAWKVLLQWVRLGMYFT